MNTLKLKCLLSAVIACSLSLSLLAQPRVKNVIFMIGDGMGLSQVYATKTTKGDLSFLTFPYVGLVTTYSANNYITDSAAAGTALSSGEKTKNGIIGLRSDSTRTESIMEEVRKKGLKTGITVSCSVTHATPAAYYAHQQNREMHEEIANDFVTSGVDVCIGGGKQFFEKRKDGRNLSKELQKKGYQIVYNESDLMKVEKGKTLALLAEEHHPRISEGRGDMLPNSTGKMLSLLNRDNNNGFFVMVEGSQIDWGGHNNDLKYVENETSDFGKAVQAALDFARKDGNTLIVVTADHETGGLTLVGGSVRDQQTEGKFSTGGHTATPVPVYAFGPGAESFTGYFDNTEFKNKILTLLGMDK